MDWVVFFWFAAAILFVFGLLYFTIVELVLPYKRSHMLTPYRVLIIFVWFSAFALLWGLHWVNKEKAVFSLLQAVQEATRLFAFDVEYNNIIGMAKAVTSDYSMFDLKITELYEILGSILCFMAPMLTFGFFLSFFKNMKSYLYFALFFVKPAHVFSELNEKSLALAKSLVNKKGAFVKNMVVFTDVTDKDDEENMELLEEAKELGAILFRADLESVKYRTIFWLLSYIRSLNFYLISDDEEEKIRHAEKIIEKYKRSKKTKLFVFSNNIESKCFLEALANERNDDMRLLVTRVNDIRALIYHNLDENGLSLFENANLPAEGDSDQTHEIVAVIVGLGQYGMEMLKALLWFCQIPGYRIRIHAFDENENAESIVKAACPGIMDQSPMNDSGDMRYTVSIQTAKFGTAKFYDEIDKIDGITYMFVSLGADKANLTASTEIRSWLLHSNKKPHIETVVYDSSLKERIDDTLIRQDIKVFGDLDAFYSEGTVINSELVDDGFQVHERWDQSKNNFYMHDYNYSSSMASALHRRLRTKITRYISDCKVEKTETKADKAWTIFPCYYDAEYHEDQATFVEIFHSVNNNDELKKLSEQMKKFKDFFYIILGYMHYAELSPEERRSVLQIAQKSLKKNLIKKLRGHVPVQTAEWLDACLLEKIQALSDIREYVMSDIFYKELKLRLKQDKAEKVAATVKQVKKLIHEADCVWTVPMLRDQENYMNGYEAALVFDKPLKSKSKREENEKKLALKLQANGLVAIYNSIVEWKTNGIDDAMTLRELRLQLEAYPSDDDKKQKIDQYILENLYDSDDAAHTIAEYFNMGKFFAYIEHIRWNAYMRTEGFRLAAETKRENKLHFDLVPVQYLTFGDCVKDI